MNKIIIAFLFIGLLIVTGCVKTIADVKTEENVGKKVAVHGTVESSIKIGSLSAYTVKDDSGTIGVSSESLPKEGSTVTVSGVLMQDSIFGYYIKAD